MSSREVPETKIFVSSAKRMNSPSFEQLIISFMYIRNNKGPNTLPCGTPNMTSSGSDFSLRHSVNCVRFERYDFIRLLAFPRIPYLSNL